MNENFYTEYRINYKENSTNQCIQAENDTAFTSILKSRYFDLLGSEITEKYKWIISIWKVAVIHLNLLKYLDI